MDQHCGERLTHHHRYPLTNVCFYNPESTAQKLEGAAQFIRVLVVGMILVVGYGTQWFGWHATHLCLPA